MTSQRISRGKKKNRITSAKTCKQQKAWKVEKRDTREKSMFIVCLGDFRFAVFLFCAQPLWLDSMNQSHWTSLWSSSTITSSYPFFSYSERISHRHFPSEERTLCLLRHRGTVVVTITFNCQHQISAKLTWRPHECENCLVTPRRKIFFDRIFANRRSRANHFSFFEKTKTQLALSFWEGWYLKKRFYGRQPNETSFQNKTNMMYK